MGLRVKEICKAKKMPLGILAKQLGISRTALANQINGNPTIGSLERIAVELECSVFELMEPAVGFFHIYDENGIYKGLLKS